MKKRDSWLAGRTKLVVERARRRKKASASIGKTELRNVHDK